MNITFEQATPADAEQLTHLQVLAFHEDANLYPGVEIGGPPGYDSVAVTLEKIAEDDYYKILADGQIVGGIVIFDRGEGHLHLDIIYIDPAHHNHGIGSKAMLFLEQTYPQATRWTLDTPAYAIRNHHFYEKFGYVRGEESVEHGGIVLYAYEKIVRL